MPTIPVKIECACGQKYAFEAEPVDGQLAEPVACPGCGKDGTPVANQIIADTLVAQDQAPASIQPGIRLRTATPAPASVARAEAAISPIAQVDSEAEEAEEGGFNLGRGILGAVIGSVVGIGLMYGFFEWVGFRFPLLGVGIGVLTGLGARLLGRGTDTTLGYISGGIALVSVVGTLFLMYGEFPMLSIISVLVSISMAYRISAN